MRYAEEVELLREEMRRVLAFLSWDRDRWTLRPGEAPGFRGNGRRMAGHRPAARAASGREGDAKPAR